MLRSKPGAAGSPGAMPVPEEEVRVAAAVAMSPGLARKLSRSPMVLASRQATRGRKQSWA